MYSVYLVDDDTLILDELIGMVPWMDNGFFVAGSSTDPKAAVGEIERIRPDAVFCDLKMPGMDGNEMIRYLKERSVDSEFVMISAYDSFENVRTFFQQEGLDYILKPVDNDEIEMVLEKLMARLSEKKPQRSGGNIKENPAFEHLVEYIREHFAQKITLDMLSKKFGFSKNYICGLFSKYYDTSLTCFLTELRMEHAKKLLSDRNRLIKEVAADCGYSDYYKFFRAFKAFYGKSPKEMQDS